MIEQTEIEKSQVKESARILSKLAKAGFITPLTGGENPWGQDRPDVMDTIDAKQFKEVVKACRFFYRHDPLIATTINKLVEIGINDLIFHKNGLSENELRIFNGIKEKLQEYAEALALEFLLSGLVIPEINYGTVTGLQLKEYGIKKYTSLVLPVNMWVRDPLTVKIKDTMFGDMPSYFAKVPDALVSFIMNNGKYPDGTGDENLWEMLLTYYGEFVTQVKAGTREFILDNPLIFRRKVLSDSPYPNPYIFPAIESLKHKRNLRRMDYSIASRAIGAIQLFKLGDKDFPITDDEDDLFDWIRGQMMYRNSPSMDLEKVFQLFANHTLTIEWIYPPLEALLDNQKYFQVDQDIIYALGFPRILIVGETEKSATSQPEYAMLSPIKTMESFRKRILSVIKKIVSEITKENNLKTEPEVRFKALNLFDYQTLLEVLGNLYRDGSLSRTSYDAELGFNFNDEMDLKEAENEVLKEKELGEFAPQPFSPQPGQPGQLTAKNPATPAKKPATTQNNTKK